MAGLTPNPSSSLRAPPSSGTMRPQCGAYPPRRSPPARCGRCCCRCGCRRGTRLPCSPPPAARKLPLPNKKGLEGAVGTRPLSCPQMCCGTPTEGAPGLSPMTKTGMKAPQGTGMVVARADIQNCAGDMGTRQWPPHGLALPQPWSRMRARPRAVGQPPPPRGTPPAPPRGHLGGSRPRSLWQHDGGTTPPPWWPPRASW